MCGDRCQLDNVVIILQYVQISNHYIVHLCQLDIYKTSIF